MELLLEAKEQHSDPHEAGKRFLELFPDEVERMKTFVKKVDAVVLKEMEASVIERATGAIKSE